MFKKLDERFSCGLEWLMVVSLCLIAVLMVVQVILRYVLKMPLHYIEELLVPPGIWFYILGAIYASKKEEHLNARVIEIFFKKERSVALLRAITAVVTIVVGSWMIYWSWDLCRYSLKIKKISPILRYPMSIIEVSLFVGFVLMLIYTIAELVKYAKIVCGSGEKGG